MRSVRFWAPVLGLAALMCAGVFSSALKIQGQSRLARGARSLETVPGFPEQAVYVWQRQWTPAVEQALAQASDSMDTVMVLAGEFEAENGQAKPRAVAVGWKTLAAMKKPVWAVLRAHQLPGIDDAARRKVLVGEISAMALDVLKAGQAADARIRGVQLDYDCPTENLGQYAEFLRELRSNLPDTAFSITALPDWLSAPEFQNLIDGLDHFVLQVHSLDTPSGADTPVTLCDPARARQWIRKAGTLDCPFYAALPTYGYRLFFDADGDFSALSAEGGPERLASGSSQELRADPEALAALVRETGPKLPPNARGWAWFRLPVEGDALNWTWPVLRGVMAGQAPPIRLETEMRTPSEGLYEVWIKNTGTHRPAKPIRVNVRWDGAALGAYDVLNGYRVCENGGENAMRLEGTAPESGAEAMAAWYRIAAADAANPVFETGNVEVVP